MPAGKGSSLRDSPAWEGQPRAGILGALRQCGEWVRGGQVLGVICGTSGEGARAGCGLARRPGNCPWRLSGSLVASETGLEFPWCLPGEAAPPQVDPQQVATRRLRAEQWGEAGLQTGAVMADDRRLRPPRPGPSVPHFVSCYLSTVETGRLNQESCSGLKEYSVIFKKIIVMAGNPSPFLGSTGRAGRTRPCAPHVHSKSLCHPCLVGCFCQVEIESTHVRQVLYHHTISPALLKLFIFIYNSLSHPGWARICFFPASASLSAWITGAKHTCLTLCSLRHIFWVIRFPPQPNTRVPPRHPQGLYT